MSDTVETLLTYCSDNGRICPKPILWDRLWKMLRDVADASGRERPPLPMILSGWSAPNAMKMLHFEKHVRWAAEHGALGDVAKFLRELPECDWHHGGE